MAKAIWRRALWSLAAVLFLVVSPAQSQEWARAMFGNTTSHDCGTVARGAKVEHRFTIENVYDEDVHIASVSSSCGCTTHEVSKRLLKKGEKADLTAVLDTRNHLGRKDAAITVGFDTPFAAEVQLHVYALICGDVMVEPDCIQFGSVTQMGALRRSNHPNDSHNCPRAGDQLIFRSGHRPQVGQAAKCAYPLAAAEPNPTSQRSAWKQTATIRHTGRSDWRIEKVECTNPHLEANVVETSGTPGQPGSVGYELAVTLKADAPPGYFRDHVVLVTNDPNPRAARIPVSVEGVITAPLAVFPLALVMGTAEPGQVVVRNIVVKGITPFRILSARADDERLRCEIPGEAKAVQVVPVTFLSKDPQSAPGIINGKIHIETDMPNTPSVEAAVSIHLTPVQRPQKGTVLFSRR